MVVVVNGNGPWPKNEGEKPGLYARFINAAIESITVGARGKVATIKQAPASGGTAEAGKVYRINRMGEAETLFGEGNAEDIRLIIQGGASEVVISVYEAPAVDGEPDYAAALLALETYEFHHFVGPETTTESYATDLQTWLVETKAITKNFITVYADDSLEGNKTALIAAMNEFNKDETVVFVTNGVVKADGTVLTPQKYALYIAGLIASKGLASAITFDTVPFAEPSYRYGHIDSTEILAAGGLITHIDGNDVVITQGLTLGEKPFHKIRTVKAKQAMLDDIDRTTKRSYIGKITNHEDGQIAVINGIKNYLTTLSNGNVIDPIFSVSLDPENPSFGDELYILLNVRFLDSIEYVKLTAVVRQDNN